MRFRLNQLMVMNDSNLLVAFLYHKAIPMPASIPEHLFLDNLAQLDALFYFREESGPSATLHTLLNAIRLATAMIRGGFSAKHCHDFVMRRLMWRVQYDLKDRATLDDAMWLVEDAITRGIELLGDTDWRHPSSRLISMIAAQTGVEMGAGPNPSLPIDAAHDYPLDLSFAI